MKTLKKYFAALLLSTLGLITGAFGQITPSADTYTNTADATTNFGAKTLLNVDGATQITYVQFDLSSIPAGASISQATLKLYVNAVTTAGNFNVDYVDGSWAESTLTSSLAPALGTTIVSSVPLTTADKNQYILINVTPAVAAWLTGSQANDGIALVANGTFNASFDSKENTTTSHPSELDIVFAGDGTITGVATASGSGLIGGGASGSLNLALTNTCAANQVLQWNGSSWVCSSAGAGTVTSIASGTGLSGGTITGSGTLSLAANACPAGSVLSALPFTCSPVASLGPNTFTGNQTVSGNLTATGVVTGSGFQIGNSLFAFGTSTSGNAFLGFAGNSTMTGTSNTGTGNQALVSNTAGSWNTASGAGALNRTTGSHNTATGGQALLGNTTGTYNTASGSEALFFNLTGSSNTADGVNALFTNTTGSSNTATGNSAGTTVDSSNLTGSNNAALGASAAFSTGTLNNATAIGAYAEVSKSNALVLGSILNTNGCVSPCGNTSVGIGTTAPAYSLDVYGTGHFTQGVTFGSPVTFASGQTFPGTGTITGVTVGTGLTGGGTTGSVAVNLDATKVPLLNSANTFNASQLVNGTMAANSTAAGANSVEGINSAASGASNGGYFITGSAQGTGVVGINTVGGSAGYFQGNVAITGNATSGAFSASTAVAGVNAVQGTNSATSGLSNGGLFTTASPAGSGIVAENNAGGYAAYLQGNVAVTGKLAIGGDTPMSHNPRMVWSGFLSGPFYSCNPILNVCAPAGDSVGGEFVPDQPIVITRLIAGEPLGNQSDVGCLGVFQNTSSGWVSIVDMQLKQYGAGDTGPISVPAAANAPLYIFGTEAPSEGWQNCPSAPSGSTASNVWVTVQYVMQ